MTFWFQTAACDLSQSPSYRSRKHTPKASFQARLIGGLELAFRCVAQIAARFSFVTASAELDQVECSGPPAVQAGAASALGFPLGGAAKVPDLIGRNGKPAEVLPGSSVLDAELEGKDAHGGPVAGSCSLRSRSRGAVARSAASPFLAQQSYPFNFRSTHGARIIRRLNATVSCAKILRVAET